MLAYLIAVLLTQPLVLEHAFAQDDLAEGSGRDVENEAPRAAEEAVDPAAVEPYLLHVDSEVEVVPDEDYAAGPFASWFLGDEYRDVWTMPLQVPVIDLTETAGGLTPVEKGGGMQTTSLHLRGEDGHQYVLRSVNKTASRSVPEGFKGTFVQSIVQDQISSMNPLGALILPPLARAAGILHTQPSLVVIPDSPRLGEFRDEFAGMLALFERKPDEDQSNAARFGHSKNIVGTEKLFEKLLEDNDNRLDERAFARARLFDMLIGDWDRHDEQWRWAEFETEHGTRFVAVPKDRDFAFVKFDGFMNRIGRLSGMTMMRRMVDYGGEVPDVVGLNWQGSKIDRRFTASLTRDDWVEIADSLRNALSDEVIAEAVQTWPPAVFDEIGAMTISALRERRDGLPTVAADYYEKLAVTVDVVGSDKHERFEVTRLSDDQTRVVVHKTKSEGDVVRKLYDRVFHHDETDELRLYGLGGNDQFFIEGEVRKGLLVRAIGGEGEDEFTDRSRVSGPRHLTRLYDTVEHTTAETGRETKAHFSTDLDVNSYEMERFAFNTAGPLASFDFNSRDGLFVGAGVHLTRRGFRKEPYAARHQLGVNYAPRTSAYNVFYETHVVDVWNGLDARLEADATAEYGFRDFYGLGNETPASNRHLFNAERRSILVAPSVRRGFGAASYVEAGPWAEFVGIDPPSGLGDSDPGVGFTPDQLVDKYYAGFRTQLAIDSRDSLLNTRTGLLWLAETAFGFGLRNTDDRLARIASEIRYFYSLPLPTQVTLGLRAGGATNIGSFEFFQANTLGGSENLRGYARTRFAGRSAAFANAELRAKLFDFNLYVAAGELGLFGFYDRGRVWADDEQSDVWHSGYGAGVWVTPFRLTVLTAAMAFSERGQLFDFSLGFQF